MKYGQVTIISILDPLPIEMYRACAKSTLHHELISSGVQLYSEVVSLGVSALISLVRTPCFLKEVLQILICHLLMIELKICF